MGPRPTGRPSGSSARAAETRASAIFPRPVTDSSPLLLDESDPGSPLSSLEVAVPGKEVRRGDPEPPLPRGHGSGRAIAGNGDAGGHVWGPPVPLSLDGGSAEGPRAV